jgi:uncharacterized protein (DUF2236 family)
MNFFVPESSIVRQIWGKSDTILFIFAGASAEFALNKAVDWLYFTGKLPADPLGRLFSTVSYARQIVFAPKDEAEKAIDKITAIHSAIENARGSIIPDWAYRDVLFMLIHYSLAAYELLERKLTDEEKEELYAVFRRIGLRMQLTSLPSTYKEWLPVRNSHLQNDLEKSHFTIDLFEQYKLHLGRARFKILKEAQVLVVPPHVRKLMGFKKFSLLQPVVPLYKFSRMIKMDTLVKKLLLPPDYQEQIKALDVVH